MNNLISEEAELQPANSGDHPVNMNNLNPEEVELLGMIKEKEALRPHFFRKAKGLKWFDALDRQGFFTPDDSLKPYPAKEKGYVVVPYWSEGEYLEKIGPKIRENKAYAEKVLVIIRTVTQHAIDNEYGNWRVWSRFSKVIQNISADLITPNDLKYIDYWLNDKCNTAYVVDDLITEWVPDLLNQDAEVSHALALELIKLLFMPRGSNDVRWNTSLILDEAVDQSAAKAGEVAGQNAVDSFKTCLEKTLKASDDKTSYSWRETIEDSEQNIRTKNAEYVLINGMREALLAFVRNNPRDEDVKSYVKGLLQNQLDTVKRIAIYAVDQCFKVLKPLVPDATDKDLFTDNCRHELWHLLANRFSHFEQKDKERIIKIIDEVADEYSGGNPAIADRVARVAYNKAIWWAAIKRYDEKINQRYSEYVRKDVEPTHPDRASSFTIEDYDIKDDSPITLKELLSMDMGEMVKALARHKGHEDLDTTGQFKKEGLMETLKLAVQSKPLDFSDALEKFSHLESSYICMVIEAYSDLHSKKEGLPWRSLWPKLLDFCEVVISREDFWSDKGAHRHWTVSRICNLIREGVGNGAKPDNYAIPQDRLQDLPGKAKVILLEILEKSSGREHTFFIDSFSAMNNPRGRCLMAIIDLAVRYCRIAGKGNEGKPGGQGNHEKAWNEFQPVFDRELKKSDGDGCEFVALLVTYWRQFIYMSEDWVYANLSTIFDRNNPEKWRSAMQAYSYAGVHRRVYEHLKKKGDFIQALDDEDLKGNVDSVSETVVENIAIAYFRDYEGLDDDGSMMCELLRRRRPNEIKELIMCIWRWRFQTNRNEIYDYDKVVKLWKRLIECLDTESPEGREAASNIGHWLEFIHEVDDSNRDLILKAVSCVREARYSYSSRSCLESIARISEKQPEEAIQIWKELLERPSDYSSNILDSPERAIRKALTNIMNSRMKSHANSSGKRAAEEIVDMYCRQDSPRVLSWWKDIKANKENKADSRQEATV